MSICSRGRELEPIYDAAAAPRRPADPVPPGSAEATGSSPRAPPGPLRRGVFASLPRSNNPPQFRGHSSGDAPRFARSQPAPRGGQDRTRSGERAARRLDTVRTSHSAQTRWLAMAGTPSDGDGRCPQAVASPAFSTGRAGRRHQAHLGVESPEAFAPPGTGLVSQPGRRQRSAAGEVAGWLDGTESTGLGHQLGEQPGGGLSGDRLVLDRRAHSRCPHLERGAPPPVPVVSLEACPARRAVRFGSSQPQHSPDGGSPRLALCRRLLPAVPAGSQVEALRLGSSAGGDAAPASGRRDALRAGHGVSPLYRGDPPARDGAVAADRARAGGEHPRADCRASDRGVGSAAAPRRQRPGDRRRGRRQCGAVIGSATPRCRPSSAARRGSPRPAGVDSKPAGARPGLGLVAAGSSNLLRPPARVPRAPDRRLAQPACGRVFRGLGADRRAIVVLSCRRGTARWQPHRPRP